MFNIVTNWQISSTNEPYQVLNRVKHFRCRAKRKTPIQSYLFGVISCHCAAEHILLGNFLAIN